MGYVMYVDGDLTMSRELTKDEQEMILEEYDFNEPIDIDEDEIYLYTEYEAWIYCENYGIKMFIFGITKDYSYEYFMENVITNAIDYAKIYAEEVIKTEMVELVDFNIEDYYE